MPWPLRMRVRRVYFWLKKTIESYFFRSSIAALSGLMRNRQKYCPLQKTVVLPCVDICLVTHNSQRWLDDFFGSIINLNYDLQKINIYVVDNGSSDGTGKDLVRFMANLSPFVKYFHIISQSNVGFGCGRNAAIELGSSPYVLVVNPDSILEPNSLRLCALQALNDAESTASWEFRQKPYEHPKHYDPVTLETNWSSHACILLKRSVLEILGGYDKNIFLYGEDVELSYRIRSAGYVLRYCPSAVVWHFSYAAAGEVKAAQYVGSVAANFYIRWRYGGWVDRVTGCLQLLILLFQRPQFARSNILVARETSKLMLKLIHSGRVNKIKGSARFGFRGYDYEVCRSGAFHSLTRIQPEAPLVTIVTRTLGQRPELLRQTGLSVSHQTYPSLEWIVVQDGLGETPIESTMETFISTMPFLVRFIREEKLGRSNAGNAGLRAAAGRYVLFLDDDDLLYADHVETLVSALQMNPTAVAAYSLSWELVTHMGSNHLPESEELVLNPIYQQEFDIESLLHHNYIPIQSLLFQRELFINRGGFNINLDLLEDWNLWLRYAFNNEFVYVPKTTSLFRTPANKSIFDQRQSNMNNMINIAREAALLSRDTSN